MADRAGRSVSADERYVISQGTELVLDRPHQLQMIASRQVGSTDRAAKQHIADNGQALRKIAKYDASRRVPRAMQEGKL